MSYASKLGRARINSRHPQAAGVCDRCGGVFTHSTLQWQSDWAGAAMVDKRILVCHTCLDKPQQQLRAIILSADPVPIQNPRPEDYITASTDYRTTYQRPTINARTGIPVPGGDHRITEAGENRVTQQTGAPDLSRNNTPGSDKHAPGNDDPGLPYNNDEPPKRR